MRKARYGLAMVGGYLGVHMVKSLINAIPVVGLVTRPILDLFPTILVGPALGAALVYGHEEGDPLAARHVVREKVARATEELSTVVRDVRTELQAASERMAPQLESTARTAQRAVEDMQRTVVPAIEREYRAIEAQSKRIMEQGDAQPPQRPPRWD